jgi:hypothetical protein
MLGPHTQRDNPLCRIMCTPIAPPVTVCHTVKIGLLFLKKNSIPRVKMVKRNDKTNTGEGGKGKKDRTVSDDAGGKSLLDPLTKMVSFCDNKFFPSSWKDDTFGYLTMDLKSFYIHRTQREVKDSDGQVNHRSHLDDLLGMSTTSMDFDVSSVEGGNVQKVFGST